MVNPKSIPMKQCEEILTAEEKKPYTTEVAKEKIKLLQEILA